MRPSPWARWRGRLLLLFFLPSPSFFSPAFCLYLLPRRSASWRPGDVEGEVGLALGEEAARWRRAVKARSGSSEVLGCNIPVFITIKGGVLKFIMQTSRRFYKNMNKPWRNFVHHDKVLECSTRIIRRQEAWIFSCHGKI